MDDVLLFIAFGAIAIAAVLVGLMAARHVRSDADPFWSSGTDDIGD